MKISLLYAALTILLFCNINQAAAQGCVAIRSNGNTCMMAHPDSTQNDKWILATNFRYFKSFRHFSGTTENKARLEQGTQVINHSATMDINLFRILNDRWSVMVDMPILANSRSSLYEHGLVNGVNNYNERHTMHSFGLGDMRIAAYYWLFNPEKSFRGNIQVGLGIKLPTGQYDYEDYWYNVGPDGAKELRPVDQSIQLGDGGTGFTAEANAFYYFTHNFGVYGNFYYLSNPREQNGVRTYRETLTPLLANEAIMSVPDQYMARGGFNYLFGGSLHGLAVAAGMRLEGIPVYDLIGGSGDFRRPGYIWSIEPTINYTTRKFSAFAAVPVALVRNRTQSVTDKENSATYGKHIQGDAAFADYVINAGIAFKF
jgi:hypothetical protein